MALLRTITEARQYIRLSKLSNESSLPDMDAVDHINIIPIIGKLLYDKLNNEYAAILLQAGYGDVYKKLLISIQRFTTPIAYAESLGTYQALITDTGVRVPSADGMEAAHAWEHEKLKADLLNNASKALDLLIKFLYENKAALPLWIGSDEFKRYDSLLIKTGSEFSSYYRLLDEYRTFYFIRPIMEDVEEFYLAPLLGRALLNYINGQEKMTVTMEGRETDIAVFLKKAVAFFTLKSATVRLSIKFSVAGVTVLNAGDAGTDVSGRKDADTQRLLILRDQLEEDGQKWLAKAVQLLRGAYSGIYTNTLGTDFKQAFEKGKLSETAKTQVTITTNNDRRKIYVMGG
jgi:hypothetical protein